ncbi:DUF721 domain-containing protein [Waterburya agarophytonicola K14]|uniref:DUF721 domain-containing protein n=1 Tax=Waterburya agarophytonicola KI4 TaxID=2874699 RepID=A0A964BQ51_9CYAN|nr:DciA family protein [Waterburya agarophytonicola]MCC0176297.1 DUF721 domain-containing protein [Waterburya agarophytonicola KI4]
MHFHSVEKILTQLEQQPGWEKFRDYRQLLQCWHNTVNKNTAEHTRPLYINRQILWIATSSASRAQELSFQRYSLLKRLNKQLPFTLKDIRFSSSGWHQTAHQDRSTQILFEISQKQKSQKPKKNLMNSSFSENKLENTRDDHSPSEKAKIAAKRWLDTISQNRRKSSSLLSCPICNSPTPTGEIERWNSCYICIAQKRSREYRPPTFSDSK